jgi:hypothetical protein
MAASPVLARRPDHRQITEEALPANMNEFTCSCSHMLPCHTYRQFCIRVQHCMVKVNGCRAKRDANRIPTSNM